MARHRTAQTLLDLGCVGCRGAEDDLDVARELRGRGEQVEDPFLIGDAPDEQHVGLADAERHQGVLLVGTLEAIRIDAVVDDHDLGRIDLEVAEDVLAHPGRHRDHAIGRLHRRLLDPRGQ